MKKKLIVPIIYFVVIALYVGVFLLSLTPRCANSWIGFGFTIFAMIISMIVVMETDSSKSSAFPLSISISVFSFIYIIATILCNWLFGGVDNSGKAILELRNFLMYEIVCFGIFILILIILYVVRSNIKESYDKTNNEIDRTKFVLNRVSLARNKAIELSNNNELIAKFDLLLEDIKSSNFSTNIDNGKVDYEIGSLLDRLDSDLENIININSDDYASIDDTLSAIKGKIKERNVIINSKESHI